MPMLTGKIIQLVNVLQPPPLGGVRLVHEGNDRSYGVLRDDAGREVFFSHNLVAGLHGFDDLQRGQVVAFTLDDPFLRAASINTLDNFQQAGPASK